MSAKLSFVLTYSNLIKPSATASITRRSFTAICLVDGVSDFVLVTSMAVLLSQKTVIGNSTFCYMSYINFATHLITLMLSLNATISDSVVLVDITV